MINKLYNRGGVASKCKGLSLAEVTLVIFLIGVVAAETIPTLVKDYQEKVWRTSWKVAYSNINQAMISAVAEGDGQIVGLFTDKDSFRDVFTKYLKVTKTCDLWADQWGECWSNGTYRMNGSGPYNIENETHISSAILINGTSLSFKMVDVDCDTTYAGLTYCGLLYVDTNGLKRPNTWGKDVFAMKIGKDKLYPYGIQGDTESSHAPSQCSPTGNGYSCGIKYLKNESF